MRKKGLFAICMSCLFLLAGCGLSTKIMNVDEFKNSQSEIYASNEAIAKKYGTFMMEYTEEYKQTGECVEASVISDGSNLYATTISGEVYIYDGNDWYWQLPEGAVANFAKVVVFEDKTIDLDNYYELALYDFGADNNIELTKTESGYNYIDTDKDDDIDYGECIITTTLNFNQDLSLSDGLRIFENEAGEVYCEKYKYTYNQTMPDQVEMLKNELKASNGEERHITYNYVQDGEIVKTFDGVVPKGFMCNANFPDEYETGNKILYRDKELTIPLESKQEEVNMDIEVYIGEK